MAVTDLNESEVGGLNPAFLRAEKLRAGYTASERPDYGGPGPLHALQKATAVHFLIEFGNHACILSVIVMRIESWPNSGSRSKSFRERVWCQAPRKVNGSCVKRGWRTGDTVTN